MTEVGLGGKEQFESYGGGRWRMGWEGVRLVVGSDACTELTSSGFCSCKCVSPWILEGFYAERARIRFISW